MTEKLEKPEQKDNRLKIHCWFGQRQERARWHTESVRVPMSKMQAKGLSLFIRVTDEKAAENPKLVQNVPKDRDMDRMTTLVYASVVYVHGIYRPQTDSDGKARKERWFRGARIS